MADGVIAGDWGGLYAAHGPWLRDWLRRRTRCPERAADLAQDTFCRVLERDAGALPLDPRPFLATVARRLLVDDIRGREVERAYLEACALHQAGTDLLTPERVAGAVRLLAAVQRILAGLPAMTREAFLLRRLDGLSHAEVAARLGVSDRTVKRHIAAAYAHCYAIAFPG